MEKTLFHIYNSLKAQFVAAMEPYMKACGTKVGFSPYIRIALPRDNDEFLEEITEIVYDSKECCWYVHNFITDTDLSVNEYWTPISDLSFDELFKIAERL